MIFDCKITNNMGDNEKNRLFLVFFAKNIWFFAKIAVPLHSKYDDVSHVHQFFIGLLAQLVRATDS